MLVDTSVWIDASRGDGATAERLSTLVRTRRALLCGPVLLELRQGWRDEDLATMREGFETLPYLECPEAVWWEAGGLGARLRGRGRPVPSMDLVIAALARWHGVAVLTRDAHFDRVAAIFDVVVERI